MKARSRYLSGLAVGAALGAFLIGLTATPVTAQFNSGSTGADGAFNPTCTPTPCTVTVTLPASGVFNFTTVDIPADVTVRLTHNAANTPVTILATGDVNIAGTIDVSGQDTGIFGIPGRGGPGGFDGGAGGNITTSLTGTPGLGPGGGGGAPPVCCFGNRGAGGSFATSGSTISDAVLGPTYGLRTLFPMIGGSGGGGGGS